MHNDELLLETPISEETKFEGILIDVSHMTVRLPDGRTALREIVHHKGAAAVVPVDDEGYVYLVRQHRVANDMLMWEIPAGKVDTVGEDPRDCAVRELQEETGLRAENMELMSHIVTTPGFCTEKIGLFLATGLTQHETHFDEDEFLQLTRIPLSEAVSKVMSGEFRDAKTALGLLIAWQKLHPVTNITER